MKIVKDQTRSKSKSLKFYSLFAFLFFNSTITLAQPTASNPVGVNVQCLGDVPAPDVLVVTDETDVCTGTPVVAWENDLSDGNTCPEVITRTYSVSDDCGNSINVTQTITIHDNIAPLLIAPPAAVTVECTDGIPPMINLSWTDNCDGTGSITGSDAALTGGACGGFITRTWNYMDVCGNIATVTQIITVSDITPPTASNPATVNVASIGLVPAPDILVINDEADNCMANPVVSFVSDVSDGLTNPETITRTYCITDDCGNQTCVNQLIIVGAVGLSETSLAANIKVFPNPTNGHFSIQFDEEINDVEVTIRNIVGEVIEMVRYDTSKQIELMLNDSPGIYFISIRSSINEEIIIRVIRE